MYFYVVYKCMYMLSYHDGLDKKAAKKAEEEAVESASAFGLLDVNVDGWWVPFVNIAV